LRTTACGHRNDRADDTGKEKIPVSHGDKEYLKWMRAATSALSFVVALSFVAVLAGVGACNAISGIGDLTRATDVTTGNPEAGLPCGGADLTSDSSNCGTCGHVCGATLYCASSTCVQGCTGGLLYVSPTGNDSASGCVQTAPLKTLAHALTLGKAQGAALVQEIHACKGTYKEAGLSLDFKASFRGSYDCTTWKRTATFGYPTFDGTSVSEIDSSVTSGTSALTTLLVGGAALDKTVIVDGWTIRGSSAPVTTIALALTAGGALIENNQILGGSPTEASAANASIGIQISANGSPEIASCKIDGGGGVSTSANGSAAGSIGILVAADSGSPNVHDNNVSGGTGSAISGDGSVAMSLSGGVFSAPLGIRANTLSGGTGKVTQSGIASVAVASVASGNVELDGNVIDGGGGSCAAATGICRNAGVAAGVGTLIARANKIYGGDATGSAGGSSIGISGSGLVSFIAENNMIHGGNKSGATTHGSAYGIELTETTAPAFRNNTIFSGTAGSGGGTAAAGMVIDPSVSGIVAENNLFASSGTRDAGLIVSCTPSLIATFENNVFLQNTNIVVYGGGGTGTCGATAQNYPTISGAEGFLTATNAASKVSGDMRFASSLQCAGDSSAQCTQNISCTSASSCASAIFASWSAADTGYSILQSAGWKINPICEVSQGGTDLSATLKTDFYGATRTAPLSAGAHEQDATCTP
jgi:hypothetical protein